MTEDQGQDQYGEHGPVRIVDKREEKRAAARARAEAAQHPAGSQAAGEYETVDETLSRIDRIHQLQEKGRTSPENPPLTEQEQAELLELQAAEDQARDEQEAEDGDAVPALTAFLVIVGHDGSARATSDVNINMVIDREANVDDMFSGASIVIRDINAAMAGKHTVFGLQVSAQAMKEKAYASQLMQQQGKMGTPRRR